MNIWIKRSLSTAAITGGLLFAGAAAANADTDSLIADLGSSSQESSSSSESSASAPLEIGGINVGTKSESTTSSSSSSSAQSGDRSTSSKDSSSETTKNGSGLATGPIKVDLQGALSQEDSSASTNERGGGDDDSASSNESSSKSSGSASAPISIGGLSLTSDNEREANDRSESAARDGDRSTNRVSESSEKDKGATAFGIGALELDPQAAFRQESASSNERLGDEDGIRDSSSSSSSAASASSPISFEGLSFTDERESERNAREATEARDGDRAVASDRSTSERNGSAAAFGGGGFSFAPGFATENGRSDSSSSLGDREDGISESESTSSFATSGQAPFSFDGFAGALEQTNAQASRDESVAIDGDRGVRELDEQSSTSQQGFAARGGAFEGQPAFGFSSDRADAASRLGDDSTERGSVTETAGFLAFPFSGGELAGLTESATTQDRNAVRQVVDGDRSSERTDRTSTSTDDSSSFGFEGFSGNPRADFRDRVEELTQQLLLERR